MKLLLRSCQVPGPLSLPKLQGKVGYRLQTAPKLILLPRITASALGSQRAAMVGFLLIVRLRLRSQN